VGYPFLSPEWFAKVAELTAAAGDLEVPQAMKDVVVNLSIQVSGGEVALCLDRGIIRSGHAEEPDVRMQMPQDYAYKILVAGDWSAGMKGYIARKIRLQGDMRKMIPLQLYKPSRTQTALREAIQRLTDPAAWGGER
jgi:hypothetical protein